MTLSCSREPQCQGADALSQHVRCGVALTLRTERKHEGVQRMKAAVK